MRPSLDDLALDTLFREAHTAHDFLDEPVDPATWRRLYDLLKWGPTSMNCQPARYVFVTSLEAKSRLVPALSEGNRDKSVRAAATVIVATDTRFYEHLPTQYPASPNARERFAAVVDARAQRASARFEELKSREDQD